MKPYTGPPMTLESAALARVGAPRVVQSMRPPERARPGPALLLAGSPQPSTDGFGPSPRGPVFASLRTWHGTPRG